MIPRLAAFYQRHRLFFLILPLFISFRVLTLLLFRPGGFILDNSDFDFYYAWGLLTPMGYEVYDNLWTAYPPLFPAVMLPVFELASRAPAWVDPRLWFHLLFGGVLVLFESGNLLLIYRLSLKMGSRGAGGQGSQEDYPADQAPLLPLSPAPLLLYALLFTPVYTLTGWFESMPLFFMLLGLDLLIGSCWQKRDVVANEPTAPSPMSGRAGVGLNATDRKALSRPPSPALPPRAREGGRLGVDEEGSTIQGDSATNEPTAPSPNWERAGVGFFLSAVAAALGFLTKLTPILLLPIAVRWLGAKLSWRAARREWFNRQSPGNLLRPTLYALIFFGVIVAVGYPLTQGDPDLRFSLFQINAIRPPWQSVWALLDGYTGMGDVRVDPRNLDGITVSQWQSSLPWGLITLAFIALYLWLYTRRYDWSQPRTPVAFAAVSVLWLFLYSKGWSPQFLVWVLAFTVLLLPTLRGVALAIGLTAINVVEVQVYSILLAESQPWLLTATVVTRTLLLLWLAVEFLGQIWPQPKRGAILRRVSGGLVWVTLSAALIGALVASPRVAEAYAARRLAEHPCRQAVEFLRDQAPSPTNLIVTGQPATWQLMQPWLRESYDLQVVDTYSYLDEAPEVVAARRLAELAAQADGDFWWLEFTGDNYSFEIPRSAAYVLEADASAAAQAFLERDDVATFERQTFGDCTLQRVLQLPSTPLAAAQVAGGPVALVDAAWAAPKVDSPWQVVLYWRAESSVAESYTVFTQLFDASGAMIAQQDNLPVRGLAPTETWQPGTIIRDPYMLTVPADAVGPYRLLVGLYNEQGRQPLGLADGTTADAVSFEIEE